MDCSVSTATNKQLYTKSSVSKHTEVTNILQRMVPADL